MLSLLRALVQSMVGELRSHKSQSVGKKEEKQGRLRNTIKALSKINAFPLNS